MRLHKLYGVWQVDLLCPALGKGRGRLVSKEDPRNITTRYSTFCSNRISGFPGCVGGTLGSDSFKRNKIEILVKEPKTNYPKGDIIL